MKFMNKQSFKRLDFISVSCPATNENSKYKTSLNPMEWCLININTHGHNVTKTPYARLDHHECKIKLYRTKRAILITANPTYRKYLALQIALLYLSKHTYAHSARVLLTFKKICVIWSVKERSLSSSVLTSQTCLPHEYGTIVK
jgi:hypothetical protein